LEAGLHLEADFRDRFILEADFIIQKQISEADLF
jgi:hypothetical protein